MTSYPSDDLKSEWYKKLKASGFNDIEDRNGNLKSPDMRTIAFQNQDRILGFFLDLDTLLSHYHEMPRFDRKVLELYSAGIQIKQIAKKCYRTDKTVRRVISRYKGLINVFNRLQESRADVHFSTDMNAKSYGAHEGVDEDRTNSDKAA